MNSFFEKLESTVNLVKLYAFGFTAAGVSSVLPDHSFLTEIDILFAILLKVLGMIALIPAVLLTFKKLFFSKKDSPQIEP
jgi:hypothetical protein